MQDIQAWLKNRDYLEGVNLYSQYGGNSFLKDLFASGPSDYNRQKLADELEKLLPADGQQIPNIENLQPAQLPTFTKTSSIEYLKVKRQLDQVFRQIDQNMMLLDFTTSKNVRFEACKNIIRLQRKKQDLYAELNHFEATGEFMPPVPEKVIKTDELQRLYVQINKAEKRLLNPNLRNPDKTKRILAEKRARVAAIRAERGNG